MMTEAEAVRQRHSVRKYKKTKIEPEKVEILNKAIDQVNEVADLHIQLIVDGSGAYSNLMGHVMGQASAPSVIICAGKDSEDLEERIGYYGERIVLLAQMLGLNTCWTGMFSKKNCGAKLNEGERVVIAIAIGYGENQGRVRKSKSVDEVAPTAKDAPEWFRNGVEMALLAPTAVNQQKFEIVYDNGAAIFKDLGGTLSRVDLGIVQYHYDIGANDGAKIGGRMTEEYQKFLEGLGN